MLDVGRFPDGGGERAEAFAEAVRAAGFDSVVRPDVMAWKYRKLLVNLGNAVQAAYAPGADRDRLVGLVRAEGERVLAAAGIAVVTAEQDAERRGDLLSPGAIGGRGGGSTWQSLARGTGSVETDYLNGEITWLGRLHGLPTPANDVVRRDVLDLARRQAPPSTLDAAGALTTIDARPVGGVT
jgi:2-dehydropantoate 2-reductase